MRLPPTLSFPVGPFAFSFDFSKNEFLLVFTISKINLSSRCIKDAVLDSPQGLWSIESTSRPDIAIENLMVLTIGCKCTPSEKVDTGENKLTKTS